MLNNISEVKFVPCEDEHSLSVSIASEEPLNGDGNNALVENFPADDSNPPAARAPATSDAFHAVLQGKSWVALKKMVRSSAWPLDHSVRSELWSSLIKKRCNNFTESGPQLYDEYWAKAHEADLTRLPEFVHPQYQYRYLLTDHGVETVEHMLHMVALLKPDVTFCPRLYSLISLFLHFHTPRDVFELMLALLERRELSSFVEQTRHAWDYLSIILKHLTAKFAKSAYRFLVRCSQNNDVDSVFENWLQWIFRDLPLAHLVRVMDCYICEGVKVLYRVGLTLLSLFVKHKGHGQAALGLQGFSLNSAVGEFCECLTEYNIDPERLLKLAFSIRNFSRSQLNKLTTLAIEQHKSRQVRAASIDADARAIPHVTSGLVPVVTDGILSRRDLWLNLWAWIPARMQTEAPELLFTSQEDGTSLHTLYNKSEHCVASIIIIKSTNAEIFGAYCSAPWNSRHRNENGQITTNFFGTGETFVFTLRPEFQVYSWVGLSGKQTETEENMFMAGDNTMLTVGGGGGFAFQLDENLTHGLTNRCATFDNKLLTASEDFSCAVVEVYKLR